MFSVVGPAGVEGRRVADLYAGTGAVGLDALSRGAAWVDFVETNRVLCNAVRTRLREWSLEERARVYRGRVLTVLRTLPGGYDLVVADPPYGSGELMNVVERLQSPRLLSDGGLVVLEHRADCTAEFAVGRLKLDTRRTYGDTSITVLVAGVVDG